MIDEESRGLIELVTPPTAEMDVMFLAGRRGRAFPGAQVEVTRHE